MKALVIGANSVRRLLRDRANVFFVFMLPMLLILVLGAAFGGSYDPRMGIVTEGSGQLGAELAESVRLTEGVEVRDYSDRDALILAVERGQLEAGLIVPTGYDDTLRAGGSVNLEFVARTDPTSQALRNTVDSAAVRQGTLLRAAAFADSQGVLGFSDALELAGLIAETSPQVLVAQEAVGEPFIFQRLGAFDMGAYSQLLLFIFLTSMTGSSALIQSRRLGVSRRMLATPTSVGTILAGESLGRLAVALVQGLFIIFGSAIVFGVDWGDPVAAAAIVIVFSAGAAATGMLMGAVFKNDQQAGGLGVVIGLGLAALGGAMMPLSIMKLFSPGLWRVAHVTPHAWGIEAFEEIIIRDGTVADIVLELGILGAFAAVVFVLATWRLRVALTRS
ncbi:MAG: ABC transporter permease [Actinobacteria bacterium]|nr:ABC transporter permease [Actinomycetota bacterium]